MAALSNNRTFERLSIKLLTHYFVLLRKEIVIVIFTSVRLSHKQVFPVSLAVNLSRSRVPLYTSILHSTNGVVREKTIILLLIRTSYFRFSRVFPGPWGDLSIVAPRAARGWPVVLTLSTRINSVRSFTLSLSPRSEARISHRGW
jgi:hypothetical protein